MAASQYPPFSFSLPSQYDLSTYIGRVRHFYTLTDPRTLLASDAEVKAAQDRLQAYRQTGQGDDAKLWQSRQLIESMFHPDTGEKVMAPFRFSAFALCNIPICAMLLSPTNSNLFIGVAQFVNQSYNVAVNYANRNASSEMSMQTLGTAYAAAVGSSCGIAFGMKYLTQRFQPKNPSPLRLAMQRSIVPYFAVVGIINLLFIRQKELVDGIIVYDKHGNNLGKSVEAGKDAIFKCSIARALWTIPMVLPPFLMTKLNQTSAFKKSPKLSFITELACIGLMVVAFLPPALAVFPQYDSLPAARVEPEIQASGVDTVYFNKGL